MVKMSLTATIPSKEWMPKPRLSAEYLNGVLSFITYLKQNRRSLGDDGYYYCPCTKCHNVAAPRKSVGLIAEHLICNGMDKSYTTWIYHGEQWGRSYGSVGASTCATDHIGDSFPRMSNMVNDAFGCFDENDYCMKKAKTAWKDQKYQLAQDCSESGSTNLERKTNKPNKWVKQEDCKKFVDWRSTKEANELSAKYKEMRTHLTSPHAASRKGVAKRAEDLKKRKIDGSPVTRTELFIECHTRFDKSALMPEATQAIVFEKDKRCRIQGMGAGVSKTTLRYTDPIWSEFEDMKSQLINMNKKVEIMIQQISSMAQSVGASSHSIPQSSSHLIPQPHKEMSDVNASKRRAGKALALDSSSQNANGRKCLLKNLRHTKSFAIGLVVPSEDQDLNFYTVCIEEIFDRSAELQDPNTPEGMTFGDICVGEVLRWPRFMSDLL